MAKLVCDKCGVEYTDEDSITMARRYQAQWESSCKRDGDEPRGVCPCPNISCLGELILKEE